MSALVRALIIIFSQQGGNTPETDWEAFQRTILPYHRYVVGWCPKEKAIRMMNLIHDTQPEVCVEIGVYGGSSIYPTAQALKYNKKGVVYGIDPWKNGECTEGYKSDDPNFTWWNQIDLARVYEGYISMLHMYQLDEFCHTMVMTSMEAVHCFPDGFIDILHIDGNHTVESALFDAKSYLPKVKSGGCIWFDDVDWETTRPAVEYLLEHCILDQSSNLTDPYLLFRKK